MLSAHVIIAPEIKMLIMKSLFFVSSFIFMWSFLNIFESVIANSTVSALNNKPPQSNIPDPLVVMKCKLCRAPVENYSCQLSCNSTVHIKCVDTFFRNNQHLIEFTCPDCFKSIDYFEFLGSILNSKSVPDGMAC